MTKSICSVMFAWPGPQIDKTISVKWIPTIFSGVRPPLPPVKSPNIVSKRSSQIKSGETYFGRSLVFPAEIGSVLGWSCQPSSVKREVKGPLLTSICDDQIVNCIFGSNVYLQLKILPLFMSLTTWLIDFGVCNPSTPKLNRKYEHKYSSLIWVALVYWLIETWSDCTSWHMG